MELEGNEKTLPPTEDSADLSLIRRLMGPAMLGMVGMVGMLPAIFDSGGIPDMLDMLGMGGMGAPTDGGTAGDLTAETRVDTCETLKFGGGWLIRAVERFNFGILEPVCKQNNRHTRVASSDQTPFTNNVHRFSFCYRWTNLERPVYQISRASVILPFANVNPDKRFAIRACMRG